MHLREVGQSCEEGAELRTRCGLQRPFKETTWDAMEAVAISILEKRPLEICQECLDLEVSEIIRQMNCLSTRLRAYRQQFWGHGKTPDQPAKENPK